jgi:hypothetical protein
MKELKNTTMNFRIPRYLKRRVEEVAKEEGVSQGEYLRYLIQEDRKKKDIVLHRCTHIVDGKFRILEQRKDNGDIKYYTDGILEYINK